MQTRKKGTAFSRLILAITLVISSLIVGWATIGFTTDFDLARTPEFQAIVFVGMLLLTSFSISFARGSLKLMRLESLTRVKTRAFSAFSVIFIILSGFTIGLLAQKVYIGTIRNGTGYNDGPWSTWHTDPCNSITITWLTASPNAMVLHYGTNPALLDQVYNDATLVNLHKAISLNLLPNTTYYYRIPETFSTPHASTTFTFHTAASNLDQFRFAVLGDKQPTDAHLLESNGFVADGIIAQNYDFVCQVGDLASSGTDVLDWHKTLDSLARIGATAPLLMAIGNHDWDGLEGAANWRQLFSYPWAGTEAASFYSLDYGNAHFVMLDNFELFYRMSAGQLAWIVKDITSAKARGATWIFCLFHLSIFTTATSGMLEDLQRLLVPVFDQLPVDAVFFGHDHDYEHYNYTYGANNLVYSPDHTWNHHSVQYFVTGGGANLEVDYGVLTMKPTTYDVEWYNLTTSNYETIQYEQRPWNQSRYVTNLGFPRNYTQYSDTGEYDGKYFYHAPAIESYFDFAPTIGLTYGEQAYHFMDVQVNGNQCVIRALYPNGDVMKGPGDAFPQIYVLQK